MTGSDNVVLTKQEIREIQKRLTEYIDATPHGQKQIADLCLISRHTVRAAVNEDASNRELSTWVAIKLALERIERAKENPPPTRLLEIEKNAQLLSSMMFTLNRYREKGDTKKFGEHWVVAMDYARACGELCDPGLHGR